MAFKISEESFGKIHGNERVADYAFKATVNGIENVYVCEVRNYELSNLFIHDLENPVLLIRNRELTYFVNEEDRVDYMNLFLKVEEIINEYGTRIIN